MDVGQRLAQLDHRGLADLGDAGQRHSDHLGNLFHGEFLSVVKGQNELLALAQPGDGFGQMLLHFSLQTEVEGIGIIEVGRGLDYIHGFGLIIRNRDLLTGKVQGIELSGDPAQMIDVQFHLGCDLGFDRMPSQPRFQAGGRVGDFARAPPQGARSPVDLAKAVENRAAYAEFCESPELGVLGVVEAAVRLEQPDHAGADQVLQLHVLGKPLANARGNVVDLRQLLQHPFIFSSRICCAHCVSHLSWRHGCTSHIIGIAISFIAPTPETGSASSGESQRARRRRSWE